MEVAISEIFMSNLQQVDGRDYTKVVINQFKSINFNFDFAYVVPFFYNLIFLTSVAFTSVKTRNKNKFPIETLSVSYSKSLVFVIQKPINGFANHLTGFYMITTADLVAFNKQRVTELVQFLSTEDYSVVRYGHGNEYRVTTKLLQKAT